MLPINEIKPKIVTDFLKTRIAVGSEIDCRFKSIRDIVEQFVANRMRDESIVLSPEQEEAVKSSFLRIFEMKLANKQQVCF